MLTVCCYITLTQLPLCLNSQHISNMKALITLVTLGLFLTSTQGAPAGMLFFKLYNQLLNLVLHHIHFSVDAVCVCHNTHFRWVF